MSHEKLKWMKDSLICVVENQLCNLNEVDTEELGDAIDMIKDLEEAIYYCTVTEAMNKQGHEMSMEMKKATINRNLKMIACIIAVAIQQCMLITVVDAVQTAPSTQKAARITLMEASLVLVVARTICMLTLACLKAEMAPVAAITTTALCTAMSAKAAAITVVRCIWKPKK